MEQKRAEGHNYLWITTMEKVFFNSRDEGRAFMKILIVMNHLQITLENA